MTAVAETERAFSELGPTSTTSTVVAEWPNSAVGATHLSSDDPRGVTTMHVDPRDGYAISCYLGEVPAFEDWAGGEHNVFPGEQRPAFNIFDLSAGRACDLHGRFDGLFFYIPRAALDDVADAANAPRIEALRTPQGWTADDAVMSQTGPLLRQAMEQPAAAGRLFTSHLLMALVAHVAQRYGGLQEGARQATGGLAPWQARRARDLLAANLKSPPSIGEVASEVGLSPWHFARAFKASIGRAPHAWLQDVRVDRAKTLLADPKLPLAAVAMESGFADQSHLTRIFGRLIGTTPGRWRAHMRTG
jgi:AraC family transcriptional regulator